MSEGNEKSTRDRLVDAARELFWARGYEATSVSDILERAGVNSGSLYHFFDGKQDLLLAVVDRYREFIWPNVFSAAFEDIEDPIERIFDVLAQYREALASNGCTRGCPIGNLALEVSDTQPAARVKLAETFEEWRQWVAACLKEAGGRLPPGTDRDALATLVLTTMEGGVMQARVHRDIRLYDQSVAQLRAYLSWLAKDAAGPPPDPESASERNIEVENRVRGSSARWEASSTPGSTRGAMQRRES